MALFAGLCLLVLLSVFLGRYPDPGIISPDRLASDQLAQNLVLNLRLPRVLSAVLLGMSLAVAGEIFQMIFGNPLVEPGFLGVTQGASFGAALMIVAFGGAGWMVQGAALGFALLGLALSYFVAQQIRYGGWVLRLVLGGIAISAMFSSGVGILKYLADPITQLSELTFWLLGGLSGITWAKVLSILPLCGVGLVVAFGMRWRLNLLSLGEQTSFSLGAAPGRERTLLVVAATAATAAVISVSGMVQWIGLIVPHLARRIFGADARYAVPASMLLGAMFSLVCDDVARVATPGEIPLGIVTSLLGALGFMILMIFYPKKGR